MCAGIQSKEENWKCIPKIDIMRIWGIISLIIIVSNILFNEGGDGDPWGIIINLTHTLAVNKKSHYIREEFTQKLSSLQEASQTKQTEELNTSGVTSLRNQDPSSNSTQSYSSVGFETLSTVSVKEDRHETDKGFRLKSWPSTVVDAWPSTLHSTLFHSDMKLALPFAQYFTHFQFVLQK